MSLIIFLAEEFDNYMQQDAHEFLNFLINHISEIILGEDVRWWKNHCLIIQISAERSSQLGKGKNQVPVDALISQPEPTWVHEIFQGIMTSETRCLNCETVSYERNNQQNERSNFDIFFSGQQQRRAFFWPSSRRRTKYKY